LNTYFHKPAPRRRLAHYGVYGTTQLHMRNPYVLAFWSALFPGLGHFLLSRYLRGYTLCLWEIIINLMSNVNLALLYTMFGDFETAKSVINIRWALLYIPGLAFAVIDAYRSAVDLNKQFILAVREAAPVRVFSLGVIGVNTLDKVPPFVPCAWCLLTPGLGQLMLHRFVSGFFLIVVWGCIVYMSKVLPAIYMTSLGLFDEARAVLNPQWFMNIPSVFFFCSYVTYTDAVEQNKLFDMEQAQFLAENYRGESFPFPHNIQEE
jgi:TM2 domain-containing membrane protein YozV